MSNEIIQPMSPGDVLKWLERHPKPWKINNEFFRNTYISGGANNEIDADDLAAYALYLELCVCQQRGEIEELQRMHSALVELYDKLKREHEPDSYCLYCNEGMLETDREFVDQRDSVHCSQECVDKAEAQW